MAVFLSSTTGITSGSSSGFSSSRQGFSRSSSLSAEGSKSGRLLEIARSMGADHYITGPSARNYLDEDLFRQAGVEIEYFVYDYPQYAQPFDGFGPHVSILDLHLAHADSTVDARPSMLDASTALPG